MGRSQHAAARALAGIDWLAALGEPAVAALAALAEPFAVAEGARLFAQNDPADGFYLLESGAIAVVSRTPGDGHVELARLAPGAALGEFCLLDGGRRSAEAVAVADSHGWRVDLDRFAGVLASGDAMARSVAAALRRQVALRAQALVETLSPAGAIVAPAAHHAAVPAKADHLAARLHSFPGFDRFDAGQWDALAAAGRTMAAPRGAIISAAGQAPAGLWIVLRGALQWQTASGLQLLVHGPGALVGGGPATLGRAWPARLVVREDAELLLLPVMPDAESRLGDALGRLLGIALVRDQRRLTRVRARLSALEAA